MSGQHTKEPWLLSERPNGPFLGIYSNFTIDGKPCFSGRQAIASVHYEGKKGSAKYHEMFKANARRIVACVNACKGASTDDLEQGAAMICGQNQIKYFEQLKEQHAELLAALKWLEKDYGDEFDDGESLSMDAARAAIAKAEAKS